MFLTKTDFLIYLDAPMHLWAKVNNQYNPKRSTFDKHLARQGYKIEKLAKQFLKKHIKDEYKNAQLDFQKTLKDGSYQTRIDALVYDQKNKVYDLYEIKSSTRLKTEHKYDLAFQYLIAQNTEFPLRNIFLVNVNSDYIKKGNLDLNQFFKIEKVNQVCEKYKQKILTKKEKALEIIKKRTPEGLENCHKPDKCPCPELCHPNLDNFPIYDLVRGKHSQFNKLMQMGISSVGDIPDSLRLNKKQRLQIKSAKQKKPILDYKKIKKELNSLEFPLYFLDYETYNPAVPMFDKYKPYQHVTFQYSLHILKKPDDREFEHHEFIYTENNEPSAKLCKHLLSRIGEKGSILVWYKKFEKSRNKELARLQPQYAKQLKNINQRIYDLMETFSKGYYVDYRFHGSASIKEVLPVLIPKLSYANMNIQDGAEAMMQWYQLVHKNKNLSIEEKEQIKTNLLKYCHLDSLAMVEIWKKMQQITTQKNRNL